MGQISWPKSGRKGIGVYTPTQHGGGAWPTAGVLGWRQSSQVTRRASAHQGEANGTKTREKGGLESSGHDAGDHGETPTR